MRNSCEAVCEFPRQCFTNQRLSFDLDCTGQYLVTGSHDGRVAFYDIIDSLNHVNKTTASLGLEGSFNNNQNETELNCLSSISEPIVNPSSVDHDNVLVIDVANPCYFLDLNKPIAPLSSHPLLIGDICNGVVLHPFYPLLATSTGGRHFDADLEADLEDPVAARVKRARGLHSILFFLSYKRYLCNLYYPKPRACVSIIKLTMVQYFLLLTGNTTKIGVTAELSPPNISVYDEGGVEPAVVLVPASEFAVSPASLCSVVRSTAVSPIWRSVIQKPVSTQVVCLCDIFRLLTF